MLPNKLINNTDGAAGLISAKLPQREGVRGGAAAPLLFGLLLTALTLIMGSAILAAAFCFTALSPAATHLLQLPLLALAAFIGGFGAAKRAGRRGLIQGMRLAGLLLALLAIFTVAGGGHISLAALLIKGLMLALGGAAGGMLGVF